MAQQVCPCTTKRRAFTIASWRTRTSSLTSSKTPRLTKTTIIRRRMTEKTVKTVQVRKKMARHSNLTRIIASTSSTPSSREALPMLRTNLIAAMVTLTTRVPMSIWTLKAVPSTCAILSWLTFSLTFSRRRQSLPNRSERTPTCPSLPVSRTLLQVSKTCSPHRAWEKSSTSQTRTASWTSSERSQSWSPVRHPAAVYTQTTAGSRQRIATQAVCSMGRHHRPQTFIKWFNSSTDMTANFFRTDRLKKSAWVQLKDNPSRVLFSTILSSETCQMFNSWSTLVGLIREFLVRSAKDTPPRKRQATRQTSWVAIQQRPHSIAVIAEAALNTTQPTLINHHWVTGSVARPINKAYHPHKATAVEHTSAVTIAMHASTVECD